MKGEKTPQPVPFLEESRVNEEESKWFSEANKNFQNEK